MFLLCPMSKRGSELDELAEIYATIAVPVLLFSTFVGFSVGVLGEITEAANYRSKSTPIRAFVNITGCTSLGIMTGVFWPVAMPLLGISAIVNMM
jgi:hypothetical protein